MRLLLIFRVVTAVLAQSQVAYENREDISSALTLRFEVADVLEVDLPSFSGTADALRRQHHPE